MKKRDGDIYEALIWMLHKGKNNLPLIGAGGKYPKPAGYRLLRFHLPEPELSEDEAKPDSESEVSDAPVSRATSYVKTPTQILGPSRSSSPVKSRITTPSRSSSPIKSMGAAAKSHGRPFLPSDFDSNGNGTSEFIPGEPISTSTLHAAYSCVLSLPFPCLHRHLLISIICQCGGSCASYECAHPNTDINIRRQPEHAGEHSQF